MDLNVILYWAVSNLELYIQTYTGCSADHSASAVKEHVQYPIERGSSQTKH